MAEEVSKLSLQADSTGIRSASTDLRDLAKAGKEAEESAIKVQRAAVAQGTAIGNAIGEGVNKAIEAVGKLVEKFHSLIESAADYKKLEDAFGAPAESFAALDIAAKTAGISLKSVGEATAKLTRGLVGVEDETKNAGAALVALGINVEDFKKLDPVQQYDQIAKSLDKFKDGASKTAIAMALFGRGGAEQLVVLKKLTEQGGLQVILTEEQINLADELSDKQAKLSGELDQYLKLIALQALPAVSAFTGALVDLAKEFLGVDSATGKLKDSKGVVEFAEGSAIALAGLIDDVTNAGKAFSLLGSLAYDAFTRARLAGKYLNASPSELIAFHSGKAGELADAYKAVEEQQLKTSDKIGSILDGDARKFENAVRARIKGNHDIAAAGKKEEDKPVLDFDGVAKKGKKGGAKGQVSAKDILGYDAATVKAALDEVTSEVQNQEKMLEAVHQAGLLDDEQYYKLKLQFLQRNNVAQVEALQLEINLNQEFIDKKRGTDKERLSAAKEIAKDEEKIQRLRNSGAADEFVLEIKRTSALAATEKAYKDARLAAEQYLATTKRQHAADLAAQGQGTEGQRRAAGSNAVLAAFQTQRDELEKTTNAQRDNEGRLTEAQQVQYEKRKALIDEFQSKSLTEWDAYYSALRTAELDWHNGFTAALADVSDKAGFTAANIQGVTTNAFKGMEDAIVEFAKTGKLSFSKMIDGFISDIIRLIVQEQLIKPVADYMKGNSSASGGSGGFLGALGAIGALFGGGSGSSGLSTADYSTSGFATGTNPNYGNEGLRGTRAIGGRVSDGGTYLVGERGRELLHMGAGQSGNVQPMEQKGIVIENHGADIQQDDSGQKMRLIIRLASQQAHATVAADLASGSGVASQALSSRGVPLNGGLPKRG